MHGSDPQYPPGYSDGNQDGNRIHGTEYQSTGGPFDASVHGDAACVMCSRGGFASPYVQWGRSTCSNGHQTEYSGVVMGSLSTAYRTEHLCVSPERAVHAASSSGNDNGARLYTTEIKGGLPSLYPPLREVACATCLPPLGSGAVYTRWGSRECPQSSTRLYEGFMAGGGGGYNFVCLHPDPQHPAGHSDQFELGDALYGVQYASTGAVYTDEGEGYAACAVCQPMDGAVDVYTQWGRTSCSNEHRTEYNGWVMSQWRSHENVEENVCVDSERARRLDRASDGLSADPAMALLYVSDQGIGAL
jgi:hypothetical protein